MLDVAHIHLNIEHWKADINHVILCFIIDARDRHFHNTNTCDHQGRVVRDKSVEGEPAIERVVLVNLALGLEGCVVLNELRDEVVYVGPYLSTMEAEIFTTTLTTEEKTD